MSLEVGSDHARVGALAQQIDLPKNPQAGLFHGFSRFLASQSQSSIF
jgi:hypothetical protein